MQYDQAPSAGHAGPRYLYEMAPGAHFIVQPNRERIPTHAELSVLSLLSNAGCAIADNTRIWCVVVATGAATGTRVGEMIALPRDSLAARVQPSRIEFAVGE